MEKTSALDALSALAHEARLDVFRCLVQAGPDGLSAGDIGRALGLLPNTLSSQLAILSQSGLISGTREGRSIRYVARMGQMGALLDYLLEDCCGGQRELCAPIATRLDCAC